MKLEIKDRVDEKGINRNQLAKLLGISYKAATNLYDGTTERIYFETLGRLCKVLDCTPNDILRDIHGIIYADKSSIEYTFKKLIFDTYRHDPTELSKDHSLAERVLNSDEFKDLLLDAMNIKISKTNLEPQNNKVAEKVALYGNNSKTDVNSTVISLYNDIHEIIMNKLQNDDPIDKENVVQILDSYINSLKDNKDTEK